MKAIDPVSMKKRGNVMKIALRWAVVPLLLFLFSCHVQAREEITADVYSSRAGMKILSGVANVATGWMELPKNIGLWIEKNDSFIVGFPEGLLWGFYHTAARTASGALDVATFWLPTYPTPDPVFVLEDFSKVSDYYGLRMAR